MDQKKKFRLIVVHESNFAQEIAILDEGGKILRDRLDVLMREYPDQLFVPLELLIGACKINEALKRKTGEQQV